MLTGAAAVATTALPTLPTGAEWLSPEPLARAGLLVLLVVVFVESGLLVGVVLPAGPMLFTTGILIHTQGVLPLWLVLLTVPFAAVAGHQLGYSIGRRAGPHVFNRPRARLLRQEHVDRSYAYFQEYGAYTIVVTRFVPVVRTFAPVVAGVSRMDRRAFFTSNVLGGVLWSCGVVLLGHSLGRVELVAQNVGALLALVVAVPTVVLAVQALRGRRRRRAGGAGPPGARPIGGTAD